MRAERCIVRAIIPGMPTSKRPRLAITKADHIYAVNEWWRRYRDEPDRFGREFQAIVELNLAEQEGREPCLGENDWAYMNQILDERDAARANELMERPRARAKRSAAAKELRAKTEKLYGHERSSTSAKKRSKVKR
jgi:hypothetical protein